MREDGDGGERGCVRALRKGPERGCDEPRSMNMADACWMVARAEAGGKPAATCYTVDAELKRLKENDGIVFLRETIHSGNLAKNVSGYGSREAGGEGRQRSEVGFW